MKNELFVPLMDENQIKVDSILKKTSIQNETICFLIKAVDSIHKICTVEPFLLPNFTHKSSDINDLGEEMKRGKTYEIISLPFKELLLKNEYDIKIENNQ